MDSRPKAEAQLGYRLATQDDALLLAHNTAGRAFYANLGFELYCLTLERWTVSDPKTPEV